MAAGSIIVDLLLKTGTFEADTKRAGKALKDFEKDAVATGKAIGLALGTIIVAAGTAAVAMGKAALESIDAFNDLKDATGASIESISAIDRVARETGVGFETVSTALIKLNQALNSAKPDSPTAEALARIGLSYKELRALDPGEALRVLAVRLSEFADDGNKARLVQELFGKSLKDVAPLLNDLATKTALVGTTTTEGALEIEKFRKEIFKLEANATDAARALTVDLVTGINSIIKAARDGNFDLIEFHKQLLKIAATRATFGIIDFRDRPDANYSNEGRGSIDRNENFSNEGRNRPSVGDPQEKAKKARKEAKKETKDLDEQVKAYRENLKELSEAEQNAAKAAEDHYTEQAKVLDGYKEEAAVARELAKTYGFTREELEALDREKLLAQAAALELLAIQKEEKEGGEVLGRLYRQHAAAIRETAAAREELARKQTLLERDPLTGATQAVKDYLDEVSRAGDATRRVVEGAIYGLEDVLTSKSPKEAAKRLVDGLIQEFYRLLVIKPLMKSLLGEGGGIGDAIKGIFGLLGGGSSGSAIPSSSVSAFPQFATGTESVPRTGLALVHQGEKIIPASRAREGTKVVVNNVPAGYTIDASEDGDGTTVLDMRSVARAEIARASRPGGSLRRTLRRGPPDRA
jgi:hypothetical protein